MWKQSKYLIIGYPSISGTILNKTMNYEMQTPLEQGSIGWFLLWVGLKIDLEVRKLYNLSQVFILYNFLKISASNNCGSYK